MPFDSTNYAQIDDLKILRSVRDAIAKNGSWCQGVIEEDSSTRCAVGWIQHFLLDDERPLRNIPQEFEQCNRFIAKHISPLIPRREVGDLAASYEAIQEFYRKMTPHMMLARYNDSFGTRKSDIVALFDAAIEEMEKQNAV